MKKNQSIVNAYDMKIKPCYHASRQMLGILSRRRKKFVHHHRYSQRIHPCCHVRHAMLGYCMPRMKKSGIRHHLETVARYYHRHEYQVEILGNSWSNEGVLPAVHVYTEAPGAHKVMGIVCLKEKLFIIIHLKLHSVYRGSSLSSAAAKPSHSF